MRLKWILLQVVIALICLSVAYMLATPPAIAEGITLSSTGSCVVNSAADSGNGSLRNCLTHARGGDLITFSPEVFKKTKPATITLKSPLPSITKEGLTIDASDAWVILDGSAIGGEMTQGLNIEANRVTIRGLQIAHFTGNGIEIRGHDNTIGGNPDSGNGPTGEGNRLYSNGQSGIGLFDAGTFNNTIIGNTIGTDSSGLDAQGNQRDGIHINGAHDNLITGNQISANGQSGVYLCCSTGTRGNIIRDNNIGTDRSGLRSLGNGLDGVWLDQGASGNVIGPNNTIAFNEVRGVEVSQPNSLGNTISRNRIFANGEGGIELLQDGNLGLAAPSITGFDKLTGMVMGIACAGCDVEVYSDDNDQGKTYEGSTTADLEGSFVFQKGKALTGPHLTATTTDTQGNTSFFSAPTQGDGAEWVFQTGNVRPKTILTPLDSEYLLDNRIGLLFSNLWALDKASLDDLLDREIAGMGAKRMKLSVQEIEEPIDWTRPETSMVSGHEAWITEVVSRGINVTYVLNFWDKTNHPTDWSGLSSRFRTDQEIERFKEFLQWIVPHLKDRIHYFEVWNEPDNDRSPIQFIQPEDYLNLVSEVVPVIREAYPNARIAVGSTSYLKNTLSYEYMLAVVRSDIMPLVDVVTWHPMYGTSPALPDHEQYYYEYPRIVQQLKDEAFAHGFTGEFRGEEIVWSSPDCGGCAAEDPLYSDAQSAKYYARGIVMHLGMDMDVTLAGMGSGRAAFVPVRNLATVMAGASPDTYPVVVYSPATQVVSYTFVLSDASHMVAIWNNVAAVDEDAGVDARLELPELAGYSAIGIDVLHGQQQPLITSNEDDRLVIDGLKIKDYPMLIRLSPPPTVLLPDAWKDST